MHWKNKPKLQQMTQFKPSGFDIGRKVFHLLIQYRTLTCGIYTNGNICFVSIFKVNLKEECKNKK